MSDAKQQEIEKTLDAITWCEIPDKNRIVMFRVLEENLKCTTWKI